MSKEKFYDNEYFLLSALHSISSAKVNFECLKMEVKNEFKNTLNGFIQRCDYIINNVVTRLPQESKEEIKKDLSESIQIDNIKLLLSQMTLEQRDIIEKLCEEVLKGEKIIVEHSETLNPEQIPTS